MENNVVIKNGVGTMSAAELVSIKQQMNHKALVRRRTKMALRLAANVMVGAVILLPLLYAISIAFMPSNVLSPNRSKTLLDGRRRRVKKYMELF